MHLHPLGVAGGSLPTGGPHVTSAGTAVPPLLPWGVGVLLLVVLGRRGRLRGRVGVCVRLRPRWWRGAASARACTAAAAAKAHPRHLLPKPGVIAHARGPCRVRS